MLITRARNKTPRAGGFTLIEIAIVILIIGFAFIPFFRLYEIHIKEARLETTQDHLTELNKLIGASKEAYGLFGSRHYPCPSDRALPPSDPQYRKPFNGGNCTIAALAAIGLTYSSVPACTPNGGFCLVQGPPGRDMDGDGQPDPILIGGIPIAEIGPLVKQSGGDFVSPGDVLDGWGNNFTYAVSGNLANPGPFDVNTNGVIRVLDEFGQPTAGINDDGHYIIISHGPNGRGAYTQQGKLMIPCGTTAAAADNANCDNDYTFGSALGFYSVDGPRFFDDIVYAGKKTDTGIWENIYDGMTNTGSIHNLNNGNVGINTQTPTTKLDVNGTVRVDHNVNVKKICDLSGGNCFDVNKIAGPWADTIHCPNANEIMIGISGGVAQCVTATISTTVTDKNCGTGWVHGIAANGDVICWP